MRNPVNIACIKNDENFHLLRTVKCLLVFRHRVLQGVLQIHTNSLHLQCCIWSVDLDEICVKTPVIRQFSSDYTSAKAQEHKLLQYESGINYANLTNSRPAWSTVKKEKLLCFREQEFISSSCICVCNFRPNFFLSSRMLMESAKERGLVKVGHEVM